MANRRSGRSGSRASFVVIMRDDLQAKSLRVPPKFVKLLSRDLSQTATLITDSTASWRASVTRAGDEMYFKGGWENFFRDHSLGNFEFLAFHYKGNMRFHVQIFGLDQCQRTQHATPQDQNPQSQNRTSSGGVESFTSSFPHFKICLRKSVFHPFYVLPIHTAAAMVLNLPMETTNFIMRSGRRVWDVKCLFTVGRYKFSKGWRSFATDNKLKPGDTCVFELIASFELLVTIFRS
ncbi:unnamed protein product [Rhodiola kirilowii]